MPKLPFFKYFLCIGAILATLSCNASGNTESWDELNLKLFSHFYVDGAPGNVSQRMNAAIPIARAALEKSVSEFGYESPQTVETLCRYGKIYYVLGDSVEAIKFLLEAKILSGQLMKAARGNSWAGEKWLADCYEETASTLLALGEIDYVISWYGAFLKPLLAEPISPNVTDFELNATVLLARAYSNKGLHEKALVLQLRALHGYELSAHDQSIEAIALLDDISRSYRELGKDSESVKVLADKLATFKSTSQENEISISMLTCSLAWAQYTVGDGDAARVNYNFCGNFIRKNLGEDSSNYLKHLYALGMLDLHDQKYADALRNFKRANLGLERLEGPNSQWLASSLTGEGLALFALKEYNQSIDALNRSIQIERSIGAPVNGLNYAMLTSDYSMQKEYKKAVEIASIAYSESLALYGSNSFRTTYTKIALGFALTSAGNQELGVALLKTAVNELQSRRAKVKDVGYLNFDAYTERLSGIYTILADELLDMGRIAEAQTVLDMLKQDEYFEFIRRDSNNDPRKTFVTLSKPEQKLLANYNSLTNKVAALEMERMRLVKKLNSSGKQTANEPVLLEIDSSIQSINKSINVILLADSNKSPNAQAVSQHNTYKILSDESLANKRALIRKLGNGTVLAQYFMTNDKLGIILTTDRGTSFRGEAIKRSEVQQLVSRFYTELRDPKSDPKRTGYALYSLLIEPIAAELEKVGAKTLMLWLDGSLRYIPFAALFNGQQYLVETLDTPIYTSVSSEKLQSKSNPTWRAAGLGVTKEWAGHKALPSVRAEINSIVKEGGGVLPGKIYLDEQFTSKNLRSAAASGFNVLHVASHFSFSPGTEANSYLLLGDGSKLSLGDIRTGGYRFDSTDLLTLSACETGLGGGYDSQGKEIEGFGVIAQQQGAKAVLATLWKVEDKSTSFLMADMYTQKLNGKNKIEALRQAQIDLKKKPEYAHPYFWAPFILMGNWQ